MSVIRVSYCTAPEHEGSTRFEYTAKSNRGGLRKRCDACVAKKKKESFDAYADVKHLLPPFDWGDVPHPWWVTRQYNAARKITQNGMPFIITVMVKGGRFAAVNIHLGKWTMRVSDIPANSNTIAEGLAWGLHTERQIAASFAEPS